MFSRFKNVYLKQSFSDSHLYLEALSCHKKSKNGIIKGIVFFLRRLCFILEDFKIKSSEFMAYLVARGHSAEFDKVSFIPRH